MKLLPGLSFSPSRALVISALKSRVSRATGIPLTPSGRERKIGRLVMMALPILVVLLIFLVHRLTGL